MEEESEDESKRALTKEQEDEAMSDDVNEDPYIFGYGDVWALSLFQKTF